MKYPASTVGYFTKIEEMFATDQSHLRVQCTLDLVTHLVCQKTVTKSRGVTK